MNNIELQGITKELMDIVGNMPEIKQYLLVKEQVEKHPKIRDITRKIKKTQQRLVNTQQAQKFEQAKEFKALLQAQNEELEGIVLYQEFINASSEAQAVLDEMSALISEFLIDIE